MEALAPYRVPPAERPAGDPQPLPYLSSPSASCASPSASCASLDVTLEVYLQTARMRQAGTEPALITRGNLRDLYWTAAQLVTHHSSNGCNLRTGDLLASGTISGPEEGSEGCLLEMKHRAEPLKLATGEVRRFLEDGDRVTFRAYAQREGLPRIGFGECTGTVIGSP
jgi:fumarylacetoacetase